MICIQGRGKRRIEHPGDSTRCRQERCCASSLPAGEGDFSRTSRHRSTAQYAHNCKNGHTTMRCHSDAQLFSRAETFRFLMVGVVLTPSVGMAWKLIAWRQLSVKRAIYGKLTGLFVSGSVDIRLILSYGHFCSYVHTAPAMWSLSHLGVISRCGNHLA